MFAKVVEWAKLFEDTIIKPTIMQFIKLLEDMTRHLKPLYIKALINSKLVSVVFINGGAILNVMPIITLKKLGKNKLDLISTNMKMTNFTSDVMLPLMYSWVTS